ncbi:MAG: adenylosuccinate synthase [Candidatus Liptonbacteria bacterium]|nr:adenylosuccinate synthase [Candidatus Liptonbacteria bacterium]
MFRTSARKESEVIAVVGGQWGDEGKGKIVDYLSADADVVIRSQGGDNAGHTVSNDLGKFALHLVPAGIFNPKTVNIIGAGVALNPKTLLKEIAELEARGVSAQNLRISPKAHLAFDYHLFLDRAQEDGRGEKKIGTTKRGIGPTYMDKAERIGLQARMLRNPDKCLQELRSVLSKKAKIFSGSAIPDEFKAEYYEGLIREAAEKFGKIIVDTEPIVHEHLGRGAKFVIEGAHGALLDLDHGTYPKVTASNSTVGGLLVGAGMPPLRLTRVVGVFKAYQTRVGEGGMPTELKNEQGDLIRERGHEYGTTTGRPRRVGFFDSVAAQYAHEINGFTDIAITKLDTLSGAGNIKICSGYKCKGQAVERFQTDDEFLIQCEPVYGGEFDGWNENISSAKNFDDLPESARQYCNAIMKAFTGAEMRFLGIGEKRSDLIECEQ